MERSLCLGLAVAAQVEIVGQEFKELPDCDPRVHEGSKRDPLRIQKVAQAFEHGSLSGAHFAGQDDEPLTDSALHRSDSPTPPHDAGYEKRNAGSGLRLKGLCLKPKKRCTCCT